MLTVPPLELTWYVEDSDSLFYPRLRLLFQFSRAAPCFPPAGEQVEHGHPHGQPVGHLIEDRRMPAVGDFRRQLNTAIDRTSASRSRSSFARFSRSWVIM